MLQCGNSKLQNDSESPQKTNSMSVQLKTRWHLLEIVWLTATSLLLSSQLDTRLSLKTWLTQRQLYWKMQLVPTVLISVFSVEFHWRRVCVNLCPTPPSVGALWAFLLQTASKLAGGSLLLRCNTENQNNHVNCYYCSCSESPCWNVWCRNRASNSKKSLCRDLGKQGVTQNQPLSAFQHVRFFTSFNLILKILIRETF